MLTNGIVLIINTLAREGFCYDLVSPTFIKHVLAIMKNCNIAQLLTYLTSKKMIAVLTLMPHNCQREEVD